MRRRPFLVPNFSGNLTNKPPLRQSAPSRGVLIDHADVVYWGMNRSRTPSEAKPPKLTDAERHKRFVDMAKEVEASEDADDFERAFTNVTQQSPSSKPSQSKE